MKKITRFVVAFSLAVGMTGVLSSCENDAPEINASWNYITDWSKLVEAINNQSANMSIDMKTLGDNIVASIDNNGDLIMKAIDRNGNSVSSAITTGFSGTKEILGTVGNNIVLSLDRNTQAIVTFDNNTQNSFKSLMTTIENENAKLVLAVGKVEGEVKAVAFAVDTQGNVIKVAIADAATLLNNTLLAQNTLISTKADEMKTELTNLKNQNSTDLTNLTTQMKTSLAAVESATTTGFTNLTTKTEAGMEALGNKLKDINGTIKLGASDITGQIRTSNLALLTGMATVVQTQGSTIASAINRNTEATNNAATTLATAISTFDENTQAKLEALATQLKNSGESIETVLTTLLDENSALVTVINTQGETIAQGIVDVTTELKTLNEGIAGLNETITGKSNALIYNLNNNATTLKEALDGNTAAIATLDQNQLDALGLLKDEIATQGGDIKGAVADMNTAIVAAIGANGTVLGQISTDLQTMSTNLSTAFGNNIDALQNIFGAIGLLKDELEDIADVVGDLGNIDLSDLVKAVTKISKKVDNSAIADAILTIKTSQDAANDYLEQLSTKLGKTNTNLKDIKDALAGLDELDDIYTAITSADANQQLTTLNEKLGAIVGKLEEIKTKIKP